MDKFSVAILGTGFGRSVQAVAFRRHPGFDLVAIAGRQAEKTKRVASELGIPRAYDDWRALLDDGVPDLVSIATPVYLHHPMMMEALERGAHVLCEKPTAMHRFQAIEMRDRARDLERVAGINHEFRFFPARRHAYDLVQQGAIGQPRRGEILGRYALWHSAAARPMNWLADRSRGGGILGAMGSHHTDCLRQFFGEPISVVSTVRVDQPARGATEDGGESHVATADDAVTLEYTFGGGETALIDMNATTPYRWERFEIHGEEASLRWDETGYALWMLRPGKEPESLEIPAAYALDPVEGEPSLVAPFTVVVERMHDALRGREPMEPDFDDAVAVQTAIDAARMSSDAGRRVWLEHPVPAPSTTG